MWPFSRRAAPSRFVPAPPYFGGGPAGGDAFWSWGSLGGGSISPDAAETLAAVLACVNAISSTIAGLPAYVTLSNDTRAEVPGHPLQRLIDEGVSSSETWSDLIEGLLASTLLSGNATAEILADRRGSLSGLRTMPWPQITPLVDEAGELLFDWLPAVPPNAGQRRRLLRQEVLFLRDRSDNGLIGVSRLRRAGSALQIAIQLQRDASLFMGQAARPGGYLAAPGKVSDSTITRLQSDWETNYAAGGKGKTAVLPEGLKWEKLSLMSAEDAQLVELRRFTVEDVARIFSVPVFLLGDPTRSTYASAKESGRQFSMQALSPWVSKLIRAFSASVLAPQYRLQIDMSGLLAADPAERWTAWQRARQAGVLSPNEIRTEEGWPRSSDPSADQIAPPVMSQAAPTPDPSAPPPPSKANGHARA